MYKRQAYSSKLWDSDVGWRSKYDKDRTGKTTMKMKVLLFLIMAGFLFMGCKHDNNKLEEGSPVSFNPVGAWEFTSTPATFNRGTCDETEWFVFSDTMTITQNGDALVGTMSHGFIFGVSLVYRGSFSSNTATLLISPVKGLSLIHI